MSDINAGRKRNLDDALRAVDVGSVETVAASSQEVSETAATPDSFLPLRKLRLEAVFYPKFENEKLHTIRDQMTLQTTAGQAYLEVSIKHSGSLLLWSGGQRYYSKNSAANKFTAVGEILLRQHFVRAHWTKEIDAALALVLSERFYQDCSDYVEHHRLTLSFEVVTAVLGDHGARPHRDFLILTAVADRSRATATDGSLFYSTVELMEFAHRFRLPHNDCWVYASKSAITALFDVYDSCRETGTTSTVVTALTEAASSGACYVRSMYPHADFQGEILEGIVIRSVPCTNLTAAMERVARLSNTSLEIVAVVPPSLADCHELLHDAVSEVKASAISPVLALNVRQLHNDSRVPYSKKGADEFEARLLALTLYDAAAETASALKLRNIERIAAVSSQLPVWVDELLNCSSAQLDEETRQIAILVQSLSKLSKNVKYSIFSESTNESDEEPGGSNSRKRILCIVHVLHDETFQKFRLAQKKCDMPLFRGFSVEILGGPDNEADVFKVHGPAVSNEHCTNVDSAEEAGETLMLKMKLLPYMVQERTDFARIPLLS